MDDTRMDGPYDANVPYVDPEVQDLSNGEPCNLGNTTPRKPKITAINESPRSMLDDYSDRHVNERSVLPDFTLDNDDGPMDVYCLMADTEDEPHQRMLRSWSQKIATNGLQLWKKKWTQ